MISSSPMNTPTEASTGAFASGRISTRSIATPIPNETTTAMMNATQYGKPGVDKRQRDIGGERRHLALGEVHVVGGLVDHDQGQRHAGVDAARGDARHDLMR